MCASAISTCCLNPDFSGGELVEYTRKKVVRCSLLRETPDDEGDSAKSSSPEGDSVQMQFKKTIKYTLSQ